MLFLKMKMGNWLLPYIVFASLVLFCLSSNTQALADAAEGKTIFESKCAACHSIGKGPLVGPDLARGKSWTDDNLEASVKRMENSVGPLSAGEIGSIVEYLKNSDAVPTASKAEADNKADNKAIDIGDAKAESLAIEVGSALEGAELFDGRRSFKKGGMACIACHSADGSGSTMGPDLQNISTKMNSAALLAACQQTPFKVMKAAYAEHPISKQEALNLVAYFESIKDQKPAKKVLSIMMAGSCGSLLILALVAFGYRNRNSNVRKKLQRRK